MIQYILLSTTIVFLSIFVYIKIRYPFWNNQPVYHSYDFWRYNYSSQFVVSQYRPIKTKYCDFSNIKTTDYSEISEYEKTNLTNLLQCYYIPTEEIIHNIQTNDVDAYLTGQSMPSFVSLYIDIEYKVHYDKTSIETVEPRLKPTGCISSRCMKFLYKEKSNSRTYVETPIYYIDFLAVNPEKDVKALSRKLLQTHEYNQRIKNQKVLVSLIKKEIELFDGVVPLVHFRTYLFHLRNIHFPKLPPHHEVLQITTENIDIILDFFYLLKNSINTNPFSFDIMISLEVGNIIALIKQRLLYVFCLRNGENILGIYFVKDAKMQYEKLNQADIDNNTLHCIGSITNCESNQVFYLGYLHGLRQIIEKNREFKMILMEEIGHNCYLVNLWREKHTPVFINDTAYYLFNMIYPMSPTTPEKCLILTM
jgi:hypothetical protein